MKVQFPCKECENRMIGCHSSCEKYVSARKLQDKEDKECLKESSLNDFFINQIIKTKLKIAVIFMIAILAFDSYASKNPYIEIFKNATEEDIRALECVVYNESAIADCPEETNTAVVETVLNRVLSDEWPDTIYKVVHDRRYGIQFSDWWYTPDFDYQQEAVERAIEHVKRNGMTVLPTADYQYFATKKQTLGKDHVWVGIRNSDGTPKKGKGMYFCRGK